VYDMRRDAELLAALIQAEPWVLDRMDGKCRQIIVKTLVAWTGKSEQTISQYRTGQSNIPMEFWRSILNHHLDCRIVALLIPIDVCFELTINSDKGPLSPPEFFREAVQASGDFYEEMKYVSEILADGRVDELDAARMENYEISFYKHRLSEAALNREIKNTYYRKREKACTR
jgi:hypothetical protein